MATTHIIPLHAGKGRMVGKAIRSIIDYVKNPIFADKISMKVKSVSIRDIKKTRGTERAISPAP